MCDENRSKNSKIKWTFSGSTGLGRHSILFLLKIHVECTQNHVWGPPGARVMSIFVKTYILGNVALGETHGLKERQKLYRMLFSKYKTLGFVSTLWGYYCNIILWHYNMLLIYVTYFTILCCITSYYTLLYYTIHLFTVSYCIMPYDTNIHNN